MNLTINYWPGDDFDLTTEAEKKEAKRKADHAHNLRLQKARLHHGGKLKPF